MSDVTVKRSGDSSDWDDPNRSWTVQSDEPYVPTEQRPGQVFEDKDLPDFDVQRAAGINPEQQNAGLVVVEDKAAYEADEVKAAAKTQIVPGSTDVPGAKVGVEQDVPADGVDAPKRSGRPVKA